jgi:hypothetical protein
MSDTSDPGAQCTHEAALVKAFVVRERQERMISLLSKTKRRRVILRTLDHFKDLDKRYCRLVPSPQSCDQIESMLCDLGAPGHCHVISGDSRLDARLMPLSEALRQVVGCQMGALLSCIPGRLGYFEGEEAHDRWILRRSPDSPKSVSRRR